MIVCDCGEIKSSIFIGNNNEEVTVDHIQSSMRISKKNWIGEADEDVWEMYGCVAVYDHDYGSGIKMQPFEFGQQKA